MARVGTGAIRAADFESMARQLLAGPYHGAQVIDDSLRADLLQAMVARQLVLDEARRRGLAELDRAELEQLQARLLTRHLYETRVHRSVEVTEPGLDSLAAVAGYDLEVRFRHVMCMTKADAEGVLDALRSGRTLAELATERSVHRPTAGRGGDMGWLPMADMLPEVVEAVADLEVGKVHMAPVRSRYGYHIFELIDRRSVSVDAHRVSVERLWEVRKHEGQVDAYLDSLAEARGLTCEGEAGSGPTTQVLCRWQDDGRLTRQAFHDYLTHSSRGDTLSAEARRRQLRHAASRRLAVEEAVRLGLADLPGVVDLWRRRQEELLSRRLEASVTEGMEVTEAQIRSYYDDHPERYGPRPVADIREIFVRDRETAVSLRQRLDEGAQITDLAAFHERESTKARGGAMQITIRENPALGVLSPTALDGQPGAVYGPLEVPGGFSLFRIERRHERPPRPLPEVRPVIVTILRARGRNQRMDAFIDSLMASAADEVEIFDDVLSRTLSGFDPRQATMADTIARRSIWEN